jgi:hypothetical protein
MIGFVGVGWPHRVIARLGPGMSFRTVPATVTTVTVNQDDFGDHSDVERIETEPTNPGSK